MTALRYDPQTRVIVNKNGENVAALHLSADPTVGPAMAAALEMREALTNLIDEWGEDDDPFWDAARAALTRSGPTP